MMQCRFREGKNCVRDPAAQRWRQGSKPTLTRTESQCPMPHMDPEIKTGTQIEPPLWLLLLKMFLLWHLIRGRGLASLVMRRHVIVYTLSENLAGKALRLSQWVGLSLWPKNWCENQSKCMSAEGISGDNYKWLPHTAKPEGRIKLWVNK